MERLEKLRILCVDDNRDVAESLVLLLSLVGYDARACSSGAAALAEAERFHPHAGILDINMPGMDGYELARRLRDQLGPDMLLMAVTALGGPDADDRAAEAGFDLRFTKPADPGELVHALTHLHAAQPV